MTVAHSGRAWLIEFTALAAIWGSSFLFIRLAVLDFGAFATAGVRVGVAALVLLPLTSSVPLLRLLLVRLKRCRVWLRR